MKIVKLMLLTLLSTAEQHNFSLLRGYLFKHITKIALPPMFNVLPVFNPDNINNIYADVFVRRGYAEYFTGMCCCYFLSCCYEISFCNLVEYLYPDVRKSFSQYTFQKCIETFFSILFNA